MRKIAPGIFVETEYTPYNLGIITLSEGAALAVDAPPDPERAQAWRALVESQVGPLRYLVLTDATAEKLVAAALWRDVPLVITERTQAILAALVEEGWRKLVQEVKLRHSGRTTWETLKPPTPALIFEREMQFHRSDGSLLLTTGPGIIPGDLTLFDEASGGLFAGDIVAVTEPSPALATADYAPWLAYLNELAQRREVRWIVPGRGDAPVFRAELAQQQELMSILQQTARKLTSNKTQLGARARDLGQIFFNRAGNRAVKHLRRALEHLLAELTPPPALPPAQSEPPVQEERDA